MKTDIRAAAAKYYDRQDFPDDLAFYKERVPTPGASVLELGCGTGRVLLPLAESCGTIHGLDLSEAMLSVCRGKLKTARIPRSGARVEAADICDFDLGRKFDLIIAPYRVFQNLETDGQIEGLFRCVRNHLAPRGTCVLNVFHPNRPREDLIREVPRQGEIFVKEIPLDDGQRLVAHERRPRVDPEKLILYPELIHRLYDGQDLKDETVLKIAMRCYYPDEFTGLIAARGFRIVNRWGGYAGEPYGRGNELIVEFADETL
jgi:SAM-dependent methyltransferase